MKIVLSFFFGLQCLNLIGQVNLQTGAAQINIPIFSYSDKDGLNCAASLDYTDGNGLKVNEIASSVGTGWNLNCAGVIERIQNGEPDDQQRLSNNNWTYSTSFTNSDVYYPNGYLYSSYSTTDQVDTKGSFIPLVPSPALHYLPHPKYTEDREQDYFNFSFNSRNGTFVIGRDGTIKIIGDSKLQVVKQNLDMHSSNIRTTINSFIITDEIGIEYVFQDKALSEVCKYDNSFVPDANSNINKDDGLTAIWDKIYCSACSAYRIFQARRLHQYVVRAWYLSEIRNPRTTQKIIFNYEAYDIDFRGQSILQSGMVNGTSSLSLTIQRYLLSCKRLIDIVTPSQTTIHFTYSSNTRVDYLGDKALVSLDYRFNGVSKFSYDFNYGYFFNNVIKDFTYGFLDNDKIYTRLCLQSLQKKGANGTTEPAYKFNYNLVRAAPNDSYYYSIPSMSSLWQDKWGYYKDNNFAMPSFVFNANLPTFQVPNLYSLTQLSKYPDQYRQPSPGVAKYGIIESIQYPQGGSLSFQYEQRDAYDNNQNKLIGGVRVNKTVLFDGINHTKDVIRQYNYNDPSGNSTGWGYEEPLFSITSTVEMYKSTDKFGALFLSGASLGINYNIAKIAAADPSQFHVSTSMQQAEANFIVTAILALIDLFSPDHEDFINTQYSYFPYNSDVITSQYSSITVTENLLSGTNGKTVYVFTSPGNLSLPYLGETAPFSNKVREPYWMYGLPKKISISKFSNNAYQLVKETDFNYNPAYYRTYISDNNYLSKKWEAIMPTYISRSAYDVNIGTAGPGTYPDNILSESYYPMTGRAELISEKDRIYNNQGNYAETVKEFGYSLYNYMINYTKTTTSNGDIIENKIYYPMDYAFDDINGNVIFNDIFKTLFNANKINVPISSETWITRPAGQSQLISASAIDFDYTTSGDIRPVTTYGLESATPLLQNIIQPFNRYSAVRDANYIKKQQQFVYDNSGNLIETISKGKKSSVLYDYSGILASVNIVNADPGEFAYTSFEAQNMGGWVYNNANIRQQSTPTGKSCYQLSANNNITRTVSVLKTSILSFWATSNNVQINGSFAPAKSINTIPGWTYYEFELPPNAPLPIVSGTAVIDELRLYPKDSRMVTYTYDEFLNKTSECDNNNHIIHYEYDGLGKLILVKDEKGNVVKAYEYNYKQ